MALLKKNCTMKKPIISLLALLLSASVFSQALPAPTPRVVFPSTTVGNVVTYGPLTADASNAAKFSFGAAANGSVFANTGTSLATAGGASVNLQVAGTIPKAAAIRAVGRFAVKTIPFLNTGVALYDLAQELGFTASASANAPPTFSSVTPGGCYYWSQSGICGSAGTYSSSAEAAIQWGGSTAYVEVMPTASQPGRMVSPQYRDSNTLYFTQGPSVTNPATLQNVIDAANARSSWPAGSSLGRAVADALSSGESADVQPVSVTGPATSPGVSTTTTTANDPATNSSTNPATNPNTSTATQTVTNNYRYDGPSVTTTTVTNSTTVNNSTGAVTNNSTSTASPVVPSAPVPPADIVTCGLPGKPPCKIDETGTPEIDPAIDGKVAAEKALSKLKEFAANPEGSLPALPSLNWAFRLPTGCVPFSIPAFSPFLQAIDMCQFQAMFHDIMSMVWVIGGLFGAIGLFWRNTLSQN